MKRSVLQLNSSVQNNINDILTGIKDICIKQGRDYNDVTLVAVSKTVEVEKIKEVADAGIENVGENKVQEILEKYDELKDVLNIHMIGHLQRNKVKYIIDKVALIHSVDSIRLLKEINRRAAQLELIVDVLIQVNVADEETKYGIKIDEVNSFLKNSAGFDNVSIKGLMTIAPFTDNKEEVRQVFRALKKKFYEISALSYCNVEMKYLSMGMTGDYPIALEEGANMLRIGTKIFGSRTYNK